MDKIDAFEEVVGPIGKIYEDDDWHMRLGLFGMGWDKALEADSPRQIRISLYPEELEAVGKAVVAALKGEKLELDQQGWSELQDSWHRVLRGTIEEMGG